MKVFVFIHSRVLSERFHKFICKEYLHIRMAGFGYIHDTTTKQTSNHILYDTYNNLRTELRIPSIQEEDNTGTQYNQIKESLSGVVPKNLKIFCVNDNSSLVACINFIKNPPPILSKFVFDNLNIEIS